MALIPGAGFGFKAIFQFFDELKATRDSRGFDILPDGTHGSSGFLTKKEMSDFLEVGSVSEA